MSTYERQYKRAKIEAWILAGITVLLSLIWYFEMRESLVMGMLLYACVPLSVFLIWRHRWVLPVINNTTPKEDRKLGAAEIPSLIIPVWVAMAFSFGSDTIYFENNEEGPWVEISAAILLIVSLIIGFFPSKGFLSFISIPFYGLLYFSASSGFILAENELVDKSEAQMYESKVLNKQTSWKKGAIYYIQLAQWNPRISTNEIRVSEEIYQSLKVDSMIMIEYHKGAFNMPWYQLKCIDGTSL